MSFVLEALKKQEAGADPDAAVSLAKAAALHRRHRLWIGLFAVAMVINAALLLWMFAGPQTSPGAIAGAALEPPPPSARAPSATVQREPRAVQPPSEPSPVGALSGERSSSNGNAARSRSRAPQPETTPQPQPAAPAAAPGPTFVTLDELPTAARSRFPGIAFSTHIYAEDADLRAVVANGRRLQEGDSIRGLPIVAITPSGVRLAFERYEVEVPIVTDWDSL